MELAQTIDGGFTEIDPAPQRPIERLLGRRVVSLVHQDLASAPDNADREGTDLRGRTPAHACESVRGVALRVTFPNARPRPAWCAQSSLDAVESSTSDQYFCQNRPVDECTDGWDTTFRRHCSYDEPRDPHRRVGGESNPRACPCAEAKMETVGRVGGSRAPRPVWAYPADPLRPCEESSRHEGGRFAERPGADVGRERLQRLPLQPDQAVVGNRNCARFMVGSARVRTAAETHSTSRNGTSRKQNSATLSRRCSPARSTIPVQAVPRQLPPQQQRTPATRRWAEAALRYRPASRNETRRRLGNPQRVRVPPLVSTPP